MIFKRICQELLEAGPEVFKTFELFELGKWK